MPSVVDKVKHIDANLPRESYSKNLRYLDSPIKNAFVGQFVGHLIKKQKGFNRLKPLVLFTWRQLAKCRTS